MLQEEAKEAKESLFVWDASRALYALRSTKTRRKKGPRSASLKERGKVGVSGIREKRYPLKESPSRRGGLGKNNEGAQDTKDPELHREGWLRIRKEGTARRRGCKMCQGKCDITAE